MALAPVLVIALAVVSGNNPVAAEQPAPSPRPSIELHVSPQGDDAHPGTAEQPFATLERAREEVRAIKMRSRPPLPMTVTLHAGRYELSQPFTLGAVDTGFENAPIVYRAQPGEEVRISGGKIVKDWKPVTDPKVRDRLDPQARDHVLQADLRALGVNDFGKLGGGFGLSGGPGLELFYNDQPTTLARYPNDGFVKITDVLGPTVQDVRGTKGCVEGDFRYDDTRLDRWKDEKEPWVHGYWFWDWADQRHPIASIDPSANRIKLAKPYHGYGYRKGQWFYGFNLLCEIDTPGEWFLDRETGILYFWPPSTIASGQATVTVLNNLVLLDSAHHTTFRGLTFEGCQGTAISFKNADHNRVVGCTIRNVGGWAVHVEGAQSGVVGCDITATGDGGINLRGGDRQTLTPANLVAENNHIHHWSRWNRMYRNAIHLQGVGNRATHNRIHDAPHTAIGFGGNDHIIEFNEIYNVCEESNDAGAIYAGRNWTMRGTAIRYNYLHQIRGFQQKGCIGVYLDDMYCGTNIYGNVFHDVTRAAFIGGGRDNHIENNLFVDCKPAIHVDSRGLGWASYWPAEWVKEAKEKGTLAGIRFNQPPYSERYPELLTLLDRDPAAPVGSLVARNIQVGGKWDEVDKKAAPYVTFKDNLLDADRGILVDPARGNFQLKANAPAFKMGFERIPFEKIGLIQNADRASRPAK